MKFDLRTKVFNLLLSKFSFKASESLYNEKYHFVLYYKMILQNLSSSVILAINGQQFICVYVCVCVCVCVCV